MKEGWNKYKFREVVNFQPSVKLQKGESYWFIPMEDIQEKTSYVFPKQKKVFDGSSGAKFKDKDIIFSRITPCLQNGKISQAVLGENQSGFGSTEYFVFRGKDKLVDQKFLFYFVTSDAFTGSAINSMVGASGRQRADKGYISNLDIILPPIDEQKAISNVLSTYDDLIVNNTKRIAILEQMAEQIYKEWFVRMRFPGHENTKFVKGIPEGWEVSKIKDFGKVVTGKTPSTNVSDYYDGPYPFIKTPDMHGNIFILETVETLSQRGVDSQKSQLIPANSISVSCIGTGGVVSIAAEPSMTNQQIHTLIIKKNHLREYMFFTLKGLKETIELFGATGATMTNLSKGKFEKLLVIKPNDELLQSYSNIVKPIFDEIKNIGTQNISLKSSRELLLPRLISGKLSVEHLTSKLQETA
ncbi:MAG TPA: restriction endonuclease subunit S [Brumimicrobium sp.]|nr:restriction endonuclease subunit S [Brumimicrobium sp.]